MSGHSQKVADLGWLGFWSRQIAKHPGMTAILVPDSDTMEDRTNGIASKGKWEWDALRPGIRLFLESHPQKVADLGSDLGLIGLQNTLA